jgi:AcrR family transcriptional regulator
MSREKKIDDVSLVVNVAMQIIEELGYESLSTRSISAKLKVSPMTLYNYYENREAILKDVVKKGLDELWTGLREKMDGRGTATSGTVGGDAVGSGNPLRQYLILSDHMLAFGMARPNLYRFLFGSAVVPLIAGSDIPERYRDLSESLMPHIRDESRKQDILNDIYMFLVLMNSLINNVLEGRIGMTAERYPALIGRAYDGLLQRDEQYIR